MNAIDPSIYRGFVPLPPDLHGWHGTSPVFGKLIDQTRPTRIIEVGTWKGQSAITMGTHVKKAGLNCTVTCVDTWLGAQEFWGPQADRPELNLMQRHGYPQVYYQFLSNVVHAGLQDVILPFPVPSVLAARYFAQQGVKAELIYIDGSHEEEDVILDVRAYGKLVTPGGIMFGDDVQLDGVRAAVTRYAEEMHLRLYVVDNHYWLLQMPPLFTLV